MSVTDPLLAEHMGSDAVHSSELGGGSGWDRPGGGHCAPLLCRHHHHHTLHVSHMHQWRSEGRRSLLSHLSLTWTRVWYVYIYMYMYVFCLCNELS